MRKLQISSGNNMIHMARQANYGDKKKEGRNRIMNKKKSKIRLFYPETGRMGR
jgi:hypothetical protein